MFIQVNCPVFGGRPAFWILCIIFFYCVPQVTQNSTLRPDYIMAQVGMYAC